MDRVSQERVAEARVALRALRPEVVLVAPAGEVWSQAAATLGEGGTIPLIDLCSALSARERMALARRVLAAARGSEAIGVIEPLDVQSAVPDLPIRAELPGLGARIRVGSRDLRDLAQQIGGVGSNACMVLEVAGRRAADVLRDALAGHLSGDPHDLPPEVWAILAIVERGSLDVAPFVELARAADHEYSGEIPRSIALARWDDFVRHELDAVQSANSPASEAEVWDQLWCLLPENASFALPETAQPLLLRALRAGVDPARTAGLLLMHGWETEAAIAALTPIIEEQVAGYEGEYDDEIDLSTMVWAVRRSGASSDGALRLLALVGEHAAGHLLASVASALAAIGGAEARRLLASYVERERRRPPSPRRSTNDYDAATLVRLEIELAKLDGVDGRALFHELWSREAGLFADMALIDALEWLMDVAPDDVLAALEKALAGGRGECVRAQPFLRALGHVAKPLAPAIRAAQEGLFEGERLELAWAVTGDRDAARELLGKKGGLHELTLNHELFRIAAADAVSDDPAIGARALADLRRLAPDYADPLWLCFYAALQELRASSSA